MNSRPLCYFSICLEFLLTLSLGLFPTLFNRVMTRKRIKHIRAFLVAFSQASFVIFRFRLISDFLWQCHKVATCFCRGKYLSLKPSAKVYQQYRSLLRV